MPEIANNTASFSQFKVRNNKYTEILKKHHMKVTRDRVEDFRRTMFEIVDIKNGRKQPDEDDFAGP